VKLLSPMIFLRIPAISVRAFDFMNFSLCCKFGCLV